jgi:Fe-S cluster assembly protein SufB
MSIAPTTTAPGADTVVDQPAAAAIQPMSETVTVDNPAASVESKDRYEEIVSSKYEHGFVTEIESDTLPPGLSDEVIATISKRKGEPDFMLEWRLAAYHKWLEMPTPQWASVHYPPIDYQALSYYSAPKKKEGPKSLDEVDPLLLETYEKLGIPIEEQKALAGVAVDAVFDSVSVATTFRKTLAEAGVIFCSISEALQEYPELVRQHIGSVVPPTDNFYAGLNSAVFTDGTFVYVPKNTRCPMELSTYFRINTAKTGQFERTLIVADEGSYVSYLEGCTAPQRDENQLHAAVVELIAMEGAEIKYSTVQNWYPGDDEGRGGIYNFVTKRGDCRGARSKISWTQVETGSAITWKYPSCILRGDDSVGEFYSVAVTKGRQQADTGTKMIHLGRNTRSTIVSKGISAQNGQQSYRGLVRIAGRAEGARNHTQCDSLLIGDRCAANTFPYIEVKNPTAQMEHEATTSKISDDQLFYCRARGVSEEDAVSMIVNGFCKEVMKELPMEFAVEAQKLLGISLEGAVG